MLKMNKLCVAVGVCTLLSTMACVSRGDYDTLALNRNALQLKLEKTETSLADTLRTKEALEERNSLLEQRNQTLRDTNERLVQKNAMLADQVMQTKQQIRVVEEEAEKREQAIRFASETYEDLVRDLKKEVEKGEVQIREMKNRLEVTLVEKILFPAGQVDINDEGKAVLDKVAKILVKAKNKRIQIEGHSDNSPVTESMKSLYPSNWELSARRATGVVRYLVSQGVPAENLAAVGLSHFHPVAENTTPDGRRKNRRIEIVLLPTPKKEPL